MFEPLMALWIFILLMVGTPGPANLLLMSAGSRFGYWANTPFTMGLVVGKVGLNTAMAFGLGTVLLTWPMLAAIAKVVSAAYIIYLAFKGWNSGIQSATNAQPMSFIHGLWVHPLSPKTWVMSTIAFTQFGPSIGGPVLQWLVIGGSFLCFQALAHSVWCMAGSILHKSLGHSTRLQNGLVLLTVLVTLWAVTL